MTDKRPTDVPCPRCGAWPEVPCEGSEGLPHDSRIALAARESTPRTDDPLAAWCPACNAEPYKPCDFRTVEMEPHGTYHRARDLAARDSATHERDRTRPAPGMPPVDAQVIALADALLKAGDALRREEARPETNASDGPSWSPTWSSPLARHHAAMWRAGTHVLRALIYQRDRDVVVGFSVDGRISAVDTVGSVAWAKMVCEAMASAIIAAVARRVEAGTRE